MTNLDKRKIHNNLCLALLRDILKDYPDQRLEQVLFNLGIDRVDFYREPDVLFDKLFTTAKELYPRKE